MRPFKREQKFTIPALMVYVAENQFCCQSDDNNKLGFQHGCINFFKTDMR